METSPMETDEVVVENPVEPEVKKSDEIAPVEVCETRAQPPEIEESPVEEVNTLDVTKLSYELQQGYRVFMEMLADSYKNVTWPFMEPVDAESLGLWDYHERIKEPMSFQQIGGKFNNYEYNSITEVVADIRLILENCYRYNGSNHWVSKLGHKVEKILEQKLALLNRSLRDKVSLEATMALKSNFISAAVTGEGTGRRRTAPRNSYVKMINGEDSSSLLTHLRIQEDIEERERRRIREKEKKEANLVLLQDLADWEEKELGADVVKQLHSMWEIPSLAGLLFLLKDVLYIQDLSVTELELGFVYANKSSLLARIFTALLLTPHQRKSLFKKPPMKFKVWEAKLCDRVNSWYKATEKDGQELACHQCGLDTALFEVLGEVNPLLEKSYLDLTLHQRVWILKCLCDNSLVRDYDFREHLATIAPTEQRELVLGNDADNWSYIYFPIFSASDLRIYKQCPLEVPTLSKRKKKVSRPPPPSPAKAKAKVTPARSATPTQHWRNTRLRKLRNRTPSPEPETTSPPTPPPAAEEETPPEPKNTIAEGFELVAYDVESLKKLCEKFDEPPPPPKKRGRKPKPPPPRKRCEVELHQTLLALVEELEKYEMSFSKLQSKAKIKIMKESQEPEPEDEPEEDIPAEEGEEWGSEESLGDEIEDAGAKNMSSDEDFVLEDEEGRKSKTPTPNEKIKDGEVGENKESTGVPIVLPQKRKAEEANAVQENKQPTLSGHVDGDNPCSISIQTAPLKLKKKRRKSPPVTDVKSLSVSQTMATSVPQKASPRTTVQANVQPISHVPAGLQVANNNTAASVNKTVAAGSCIKTVTSGGVGTQPSSSISQAGENTTSVRIQPKLPVILNKPGSSTVVTPSSTVALPKTHTQSITSAHTGIVCKVLSSTASTIASPNLQSQAHLSAAIPGMGKVMFVTSSGVPLQVLKAVPVSQQPLNTAVLKNAGSSTSVNVASSSSSLSTPTRGSVPLQVVKAVSVSEQLLVQGNTLNTALQGSSSAASSVCIVSPSLSTPMGASVPASSSLAAKSTTSASHLSSSPVHKVVISTAPTSLANILSTTKQTSQVATTSALPHNSPVILVKHPGTGGVVPVAVKGGAVVMSVPSASQQVVVIRPPSTLASSTTTSSATLLSGTGISILGKNQIAQTARGDKVVTSPSVLPAGQRLLELKPKTASVVTSNKPVVQVAMSPVGVKLSETKTATVGMESKPVVTTTMTTVMSTTEGSATTVTMGSNATPLITSSTESKTTSRASPVTNEQVALGTTTSLDIKAPNEQPSYVESHHACSTEVSHTMLQTLASHCVATKVTDTRTVLVSSLETDLEQNNQNCKGDLLPSKTISSDKKCEAGNLAGSGIENKDNTEKENGNSPELLLDLTCYETSVSDSAGCEESDDSTPNGLHPDMKTSLPSKLTKTDVKLCNGVACPVSQTYEEKELESVEQDHASVANQSSNGAAV